MPTASPDSVEIYGGDFGSADPRSNAGSAGGLGDSSDATYAVAYSYDDGFGSHRYDTIAAHFTVATGPGGLTAAQASPRLRIQLSDNGVNGDTRVAVLAYPTDFGAGPNVAWHASLPDHAVIYDEGLPLGATYATDHWWTFDAGGGDPDPWPGLTDLLAAGNLTFEILREANPDRVWDDGYVKVFELTITVPGGPSGVIPPRRIFQRTDGKTHGAPRLFGNR
jgi:hypothetical protein